jgi:hypothetical protein
MPASPVFSAHNGHTAPNNSHKPPSLSTFANENVAAATPCPRALDRAAGRRGGPRFAREGDEILPWAGCRVRGGAARRWTQRRPAPPFPPHSLASAVQPMLPPSSASALAPGAAQRDEPKRPAAAAGALAEAASQFVNAVRTWAAMLRWAAAHPHTVAGELHRRPQHCLSAAPWAAAAGWSARSV